MNQLIPNDAASNDSGAVIRDPAHVICVDNFCGSCGAALTMSDSFCRDCGSPCHRRAMNEIVVQAELISTQATHAGHGLPARPLHQNGDIIESIRETLSNRWLVFGIVAVVGPLGLPAVWLCPTLKRRTKIITTALYLILTVAVPVVVTWYIVEGSFKPILDVFGN